MTRQEARLSTADYVASVQAIRKAPWFIRGRSAERWLATNNPNRPGSYDYWTYTASFWEHQAARSRIVRNIAFLIAAASMLIASVVVAALGDGEATSTTAAIYADHADYNSDWRIA